MCGDYEDWVVVWCECVWIEFVVFELFVDIGDVVEFDGFDDCVE